MNPFLIGVSIFLLPILAILFSWIYVTIKAEDGLVEIKVRLWFIIKKFSFFDEDEKQTVKQSEAKARESQADTSNGMSAKESDYTGELSGTVHSLKERFEILSMESIHELLKLAGRLLKRLCKVIRVDSLSADITVATEDAAKTAILYGELMSLAGGVLAALQNTTDLKKINVNIRADFESARFKYFINACFKGKIYKLIVISIIFGYNYYKLKRKKAV